MAEVRDELLAGLSGTVVEVGCGNGLNFGHYPPEVTQVLAVEPEPYLRKLARERAAEVATPVKVVDGTAESLPAEAAGWDAAVASLVLCSVPDQQVALQELHRVLRPGGELRFFEHVKAEAGIIRLGQRFFDATFWPFVAAGCHTGRDTGSSIGRSGFEIEGLRRFSFPEKGLQTPTSPHILGIARKVA